MLNLLLNIGYFINIVNYIRGKNTLMHFPWANCEPTFNLVFKKIVFSYIKDLPKLTTAIRFPNGSPKAC